ncbi:MAG: UDP-N-acetylmuramoyl-tripeptide--D-alanyl-D-alanine ligase [Cytophagales bacterium]|nr:UDP-N-acetylmuramoyl-tripeptide--D-alanyl-D-alanine ligase [Armatimonadota bacterium]
MIRTLTLDDIAEVTGGAVVDGPQRIGASGEETVLSVSTDTRTIQPGALFVALRGENFDGHHYLVEAAQKGAVAVVVEDSHHRSAAAALQKAALPHVEVVDTLHAFGDIARYVRDAFTGPVVGITGSIGKTTTKELVAQVLETSFSVLKSADNFNNEIGVPQTVFLMEPGHSALVLEMGMRGPGQIQRLAEIGAPTIGIITGIGMTHLELLGSREAIARAKGELFELLPADGLAIYPATDEFAGGLRARFHGANSLSCAIEAPADVRATGLSRHENGWRFTAGTPWGATKVFLPSPGRFNVLNALFAIAVGGSLGIPLESMARALLRWTPPAMRLQTLTTPGGVTVLSDAYNAAPDSMIGALETLAGMPVTTPGRRIAALGEMKELGDFAPEAHRSVGQAAARTAPDLLLLVGPLTAHLADAAHEAGLPTDRIQGFATSGEAAAALPGIVRAGDTLLVKGSRSLAMEQLVTALTPATEGTVS